MRPVEEQVVLVDEDGHAIGTAAKATVHHRRTPLHLAFSCYLFDDSGSVLVTQRAFGKSTWPGAWTNSVCGHPGPGEPLETAVRRRARHELGLQVTDLRLVLPRFRYRATMVDGTQENELCPVLAGRVAGTPTPAPTEVAVVRWEPWTGFRDAVLGGARDVSPWCRQQLAELAQVEGPDGSFRPAATSQLPPVARRPGADVTRSDQGSSRSARKAAES